MAKIIIDPFDGVRHLPGSGMCCFVTLCGEVDSFEREGPGGVLESRDGEELDGVPDCVSCLDAAITVMDSITQKELIGIKREMKIW
jgi:hypothetical protein